MEAKQKKGAIKLTLDDSEVSLPVVEDDVTEADRVTFPTEKLDDVNIDRDLAWRAARMTGIGGSDISSIAGISRFGDPYTVYQSKINEELALGDDDKEVQAIGHELEPVVRNRYETKNNVNITHHESMFRHPGKLWMLASVDGLIEENKTIFEAKSLNISRMEEFGQEETDEIPLPYYMQCQWYMHITGYKRAVLSAAFIDHNKYEVIESGQSKTILGLVTIRNYEFNYEQSVGKEMDQLAKSFWEKVESRNPADLEITDARDSANVINTVYSQESDELVNADEELEALVEKYHSARQQRLNSEKQEEELKNKIKRKIGEKAGVRTKLGAITWKETESKQFDLERLKEERPHIYEKYVKSEKNRRFNPKFNTE